MDALAASSSAAPGATALLPSLWPQSQESEGTGDSGVEKRAKTAAARGTPEPSPRPAASDDDDTGTARESSRCCSRCPAAAAGAGEANLRRDQSGRRGEEEREGQGGGEAPEGGREREGRERGLARPPLSPESSSTCAFVPWKAKALAPASVGVGVDDDDAAEEEGEEDERAETAAGALSQRGTNHGGEA